jgi:hypothetical protein
MDWKCRRPHFSSFIATNTGAEIEPNTFQYKSWDMNKEKERRSTEITGD